MHDDRNPERGAPEDDAVLRAREQFDDAIELLATTKRKLKRGEVDGVRDVASHVALVLKTLIALGEAREKVDGLKPDDGAAAALDLEAARTEIGGRLDRLRAAGDA